MAAGEQPLKCLVERQTQDQWDLFKHGEYVQGVVWFLSIGAKGATFELNRTLRRFLGERESHVIQP